MSSILIALFLMFLASSLVAASLKRRFPRGAVTAGLLSLGGIVLCFLASVLLDAVNERLPKIGRNTGFLTYGESPEAFWILILVYVAVGIFCLWGVLYQLRKHLRASAS